MSRLGVPLEDLKAVVYEDGGELDSLIECIPLATLLNITLSKHGVNNTGQAQLCDVQAANKILKSDIKRKVFAFFDDPALRSYLQKNFATLNKTGKFRKVGSKQDLFFDVIIQMIPSLQKAFSPLVIHAGRDKQGGGPHPRPGIGPSPFGFVEEGLNEMMSRVGDSWRKMPSPEVERFRLEVLPALLTRVLDHGYVSDAFFTSLRVPDDALWGRADIDDAINKDALMERRWRAVELTNAVRSYINIYHCIYIYI